jgi:DNA adenine methylase
MKRPTAKTRKTKKPTALLKEDGSSLKTPIGYYGGKQKMAKHILPLIPQHNLYCEPFFGGGAIFWAKPSSNVEVINDIKDNVIVFYRVLKTDFARLKKKIDSTLHSRSLYRRAMKVYDCPKKYSDLERAWALWTLATQGFAHRLKSWGHAKDGKVERQVNNARQRFTEVYADRLEKTQIENNDALRVIKLRDKTDTFFYLDPPYYNSNCADYSGYTEQDFKNLLDACANMEGMFLLSSYPSKLLTEYTKKYGWNSHSVQMRVSVTKNSQKQKTEVLTWNYNIKKGKQDDGVSGGLGAHPVFMLARVLEMVFSI